MLTQIEYLYRDASNYKFYGSVIVEGEVSEADLKPYLLDGEYFNPLKVGLSHLLDESPNDDDHLLHELVDFQSVREGSPALTRSELIERFRAAHKTGWF